MIAVLDYGIGNRTAVARMFERIGISAVVTSNPAQLDKATGWLLPGVGSFDSGMSRLEESGLRHVLDGPLRADRPLLGICLGMQLLGRSSEEGSAAGLEFLEFKSRRLLPEHGLAVPHMRWNGVTPVRTNHPLIESIDSDFRAFFVHSYYAEPTNPDVALAVTTYGREFTSIVATGSIMGVQFHPEKSHKFGMRLLRSFARVCGLNPTED